MARRDFLVGNAELRGEDEKRWKLLYYISLDGAVYSIKIERVGSDGTLTEETGGLTYSHSEAEAWVKMLIKGTVTPLTLHEVVDDLME